MVTVRLRGHDYEVPTPVALALGWTHVVRGPAPEVRPSHFGDYIELGPVPGRMVVLVVSEPGSYLPVGHLLLPHQVYVDKARKLLAESGHRRMVVLPVDTDGAIDITDLLR